MVETMTNAPVCKTQICKRPLTYLEEQGCWRCLVCNPMPKDVPKPIKEKKFLDVKTTEGQVAEMITKKLTEHIEVSEEKIREIVRDELENWHIQKPPVTKDEIEEYPTAVISQTINESRIEQAKEPEPPDWRQQAKDLGIELFHRKKVDVMKDIEEAENGGHSGTED